MVKTGKKNKIWRLFSADFALRHQLSQALEIPELIAQVLINRGLDNVDSAGQFMFGGSEQLHNPFLMSGMNEAVSRIIKAIEAKEKITIYGDYDVDGVTSCALLYLALSRLGASVQYYIPDRQNEGYGLNIAALEQLCNNGVQLIITVDCGISAWQEVAAVAEQVDIIITDHHQPPTILPDVHAILDPHQIDCQYPDKQLAGVGVAFKLCQALCDTLAVNWSPIQEYLDIVAIGTIADLVPLKGENRILVKLGLEQIRATQRIGIKALVGESGLDLEKIDCGKVGFQIAPRLNAAGRLGCAATGVQLLISDDFASAESLAKQLENENCERQNVEQEILKCAEKKLSNTGLTLNQAIILWDDSWHPGVIGIVASRLVDKYYCPTIMIAIRDGVGKGSCRSIAGFNMYDILAKCSDLLVQFGGHHQAAGFSILPDNIPAFVERFQKITESILVTIDSSPILKVDAIIAPEEITFDFIEHLVKLGPYGMGNPTPVFAMGNIFMENVRTIGKDKQHLKFQTKDEIGRLYDVIAWNMAEAANSIHTKPTIIDLAFSPMINEWNGKNEIQLRAQDFRVSIVEEKRAAVGHIYLVLKKRADKQSYIIYEEQELAAFIIAQSGIYVDYIMVIAGIQILEELHLVERCDYEGYKRLKLLTYPSTKLNIAEARTYHQGLLLGKYSV